MERRSLIVEAMPWMHHLWGELHLELFAALPECLDSFFECSRTFCISVDNLAYCQYIVKDAHLIKLSINFLTMSCIACSPCTLCKRLCSDRAELI